MSLVKFSALKYDDTYIYPWWGYAIGILLAFISIFPIPLCSFYAIAKTPGSLRQVDISIDSSLISATYWSICKWATQPIVYLYMHI